MTVSRNVIGPSTDSPESTALILTQRNGEYNTRRILFLHLRSHFVDGNRGTLFQLRHRGFPID